MKRLFLLRHAQAASAAGGPDIDRPLTDSGREDAAALGAYMNTKGYMPDLVLCSTALRTRQTCEQLAASFETLNVQHMEEIYHASFGQLLTITQGNDVESLMVIGHNPTIYEMAARLGENGADRLVSRLSQGYQPASFSVFDVNVDAWEQLAPEHCTLVDLVNPLDYNAPERPTRWM